MKSWVSVTVILAIVLGCHAVASADPIIVTHDFRITSVAPFILADKTRDIQSRASDVLVSTVTTPPPDGLQGAATSILTSSFVDPFHWTAQGRGSVTLNKRNASPESGSYSSAGAGFGVVFDVTQPVTYAFAGEGTGSVSLAAPMVQFSSGLVSSFGGLLRIVTPGEELLDDETIFDNVFSFEMSGLPFQIPNPGSASDAIHPSFAGLLVPGQYWLFWATSADVALQGSGLGSGEALGRFAFTLDFAPVAPTPTPELPSLLLFGTGLAGVSWRVRPFRAPNPNRRR
jgi:hypothetical protein